MKTLRNNTYTRLSLVNCLPVYVANTLNILHNLWVTMNVIMFLVYLLFCLVYVNFFFFLFLAFDFCRFCVVIRVFFIPATTANDLRLRRISKTDVIHYIFCPIFILQKERLCKLRVLVPNCMYLPCSMMFRSSTYVDCVLYVFFSISTI